MVVVVVELEGAEVAEPLGCVVDDELRGVVVITVLSPDEPDDVLESPVLPDAQPVSTTDAVINITAQTPAAGLGRILT